MALAVIGIGHVGCDSSANVLGASDPSNALHEVADLTDKINRIVARHPELQAAISAIPGGGVALQALGAASKVMKYGHTVEHVVSKYGGEVAHAVSKVLDFF